MNYLRKRAVYDSYEPFRSAKESAIKYLGKTGRKHKWLKWPAFFICVLFILIFNIFYHFFMKFEMKERLARALSYVLIVCLILTGITIPTSAGERGVQTGQQMIKSFMLPSEEILFQNVQRGSGEDSIIFPDYLTAVVEKTVEIPVENPDGLQNSVSDNDISENNVNNADVSENEPEETAYQGDVSENEPEDNVYSGDVSENEPEDDVYQGDVSENEPAEIVYQADVSADNAAETEELTDEAIVEEIIPENNISKEETSEEEAAGEETYVTEEQTGEEPLGDIIVGAIEGFIDTFRPIKSYAKEPENFEEESLTTEEIAVTEEIQLPVKWELNKSLSSKSRFKAKTVGDIFFYDAVIPEGYVLAEGLPIPFIAVTITEYYGPEFDLSYETDGMTINVKADPGVFPMDASLRVTKIEGRIAEETNEAVETIADTDSNVALSFAYDISVIDAQGNEIEPDTELGEVYVSFEAKEIADVNLDTNVYHVTETKEGFVAEKLEFSEEGSRVTAETDGFSIYVISLSYRTLSYLIAEGDIVPLSEILAAVNLSGTPSAASSNAPEYFDVFFDNNVYYAQSVKAFDSTVNQADIYVTIDEIPYTITVKNSETNALELGSFDYKTGRFSKASGSGASKYTTLTILVTKDFTSSSAEVINVPSSADGFVLSKKEKNVSYTIDTSSSEGKTPAEFADYIRNYITISGYEGKEMPLSFELTKKTDQLKYNGTAVSASKFFKSNENNHYYFFVPFSSLRSYYSNRTYMTWIDCYDAASKMTYAGRTGYLATVTSEQEDRDLFNMTTGSVGWLGATRMKVSGTKNGQIYSGFSIGNYYNYWYWACGPEIDNILLDFTGKSYSNMANQSASAYPTTPYSNWKVGEPNHSSNEECCLTSLTISGGQGRVTGTSCKVGSDLYYGWNDIQYNRSNGDQYTPSGFFVEFGDLVNGDTNEGAVLTETALIKSYSSSVENSTIKVYEKGSNGNKEKTWNVLDTNTDITDFVYYSNVPYVTIYPTTRDAYISSADYYVSAIPLTKKQLDELSEDNWTHYRNEFEYTETSVKIIYVRHKNSYKGTVTYISSQPIVVDAAAVVAWFIKDSQGNIVGFGSGSADEAIEAGKNNPGCTVEAVVKNASSASTSDTIPDNVQISVPKGSKATVSGDKVENTGTEGSFVVLENSSDGLKVSTEKDGVVKINDEQYGNGSSVSGMSVMVDGDDNVVIENGRVTVPKDGKISVKKDDELVTLTNTSDSSSQNTFTVSANPSGDESVVLEKQASLEVVSSKNNKSTSNTYSSKENGATLTVVDDTDTLKLSEGDIALSDSNRVYVGEENTTVTAGDNNAEVGVSSSGNIEMGDNVTVKIGNTDYTSAGDDTVVNVNTEGTPVLKEGGVKLNKDTSILVETNDSEKPVSYTTIGQNDPIVYADGTVLVTNNTTVRVSVENSPQNTIEVGEEGTQDTITLSTNGDGTVDVALKNDEEITVNNNTYTGKGNEGDDTSKINVDIEEKTATIAEGKIDLGSGSSINVKTDADGNEVNTKIVANNDETPTVSADGVIDIPAGGQVTATTTLTDDEGKNVTGTSRVEAPVSENPEDGTKVSIEGGSLIVDLNENETVKVNGSEIKAGSDDTSVSIDENGATLTSGSVLLEQNQEIIVNGSTVTNTGSEESELKVQINTEVETATIDVKKGEEYTVKPVGSDEGIVFKADEDKEETEHEINKYGNFVVGDEGIPIAFGEETVTICGGEGDAVVVRVTEDGVSITANTGEGIRLVKPDGTEAIFENAGDGSLEIVLEPSGVPVLKTGTVCPAPGCEIMVSGGETPVIIGTDSENGDGDVVLDDDGTVTMAEGAGIIIKDGTGEKKVTAKDDNTKVTVDNGKIELTRGGIIANDTPVFVDGKKYVAEDGKPLDIEVSGSKTKIKENPGDTVSVTDADGNRLDIKNNGTGESTVVVESDGTVLVSDGDEVTVNGTLVIRPSNDSTARVKVLEDVVSIEAGGAGEELTIECGGTENVIKTTKNNTVLTSDGEDILLENGGILLGADSSAGFEDNSGKRRTFTNRAGDEKQPELTRNSDGTGTLTLPEGGSVEVTGDGLEDITIKNNNPGPSGISINSDGTLSLPAGESIDCIISGVDFEITCTGRLGFTGSEGGIVFTIAPGETITAIDKSKNPPKEIVYSNNGSSPLIIDMDKDGDIALLSGELGLESGATVYMTDENGNRIPVVADGEAVRINADGDIVLPTDSSVSIGGNIYKGITEGGIDTGKAIISISEDAGVPVLKSGKVEIGEGASIGIYGSSEIYKNTGNEDIIVAEDGSVLVPEGGKAEITFKTGNGTKVTEEVSVPSGQTDGVKLSVDSSNGNDVLCIEAKKPSSGPAKIVIGETTYTAEGDLIIDTDSKTGERTIDPESPSKKVNVDGGSIKVGDTTVTSVSGKPVTVEEVTSGGETVPRIDIPAGAEAVITTNDSEGTPVSTVLSVPKDAQDSVTVQSLTGEAAGKLGVFLDADESISINGGIVTAESAGTQISLSEDGAELEDGSVSLGSNAGIIVNGSLVENSGSSDKPVEIIKNGEETSIKVAPGGTYAVSTSSGEGDNTYEFKNNGSSEETFTISDEGELNIPGNTPVPVSVNGKEPVIISVDKETSVKITEDGVLVETYGDAEVSIGGNTYTGTSGGPLTLTLDENEDVVLNEGTAGVTPGSKLVLLDEADGKKTEVINKSAEGTGSISVSDEGTIVTGNGAAFEIKSEGPDGEKTQNYVAKSDDTVIDTSYEGTPVLQSGGVELGNGSEIVINDGDSDVSLLNSGNNGTVTAQKKAGGIGVEVSAGGSFEMTDSQNPDMKLSVTNTSDTGSSYDIEDDGSMLVGKGDTITFSDGEDTKVILPQGESEILLVPTDDGLGIELDAGEKIKITENSSDNSRATSVITAKSDDVSLVSTDDGTLLLSGEVGLSDNSSVITGESKITNAGNDDIIVNAPDASGNGGSIEIPAEGAVRVSRSGEEDGAYSLRIPNEDGETEPITLEMTKEGGIKIPADRDVTITALEGNTVKSFTIGTKDGSGEGLLFESYADGPKITVAPGETLVIDGHEYENTNGGEPATINVTSDGKVVVLQGDIRVPAGEILYIESDESELIEIVVPVSDTQEDETVEGGDVSVSVSKNAGGQNIVSTTVSPKTVTDSEGNTRTEDAEIMVNGGTYRAVSTPGHEAPLSISTNADTGEVTLLGGTGSFEVENGNLTIGNDRFTTEGNVPVTINHTSTLTTPEVFVPAGGNITIGDSSGNEMEVVLPDDVSEPAKVKTDREEGTVEVTVRADEKVTIGGISYTPSGNGRIIVDSVTGEMDTVNSTVNVDMEIDPSKFNKENYKVNVPANTEITVGEEGYSSDGPMVLTGNPDGNPVINISESGSTVTIGRDSFTTASDDTSFSVSDDKDITLITDGSSLVFDGESPVTVDGVKVASQGGEFKVIKENGKEVLDIGDGTKLTVEVPADSQIVIRSNGAEDIPVSTTASGIKFSTDITVDESGNPVIRVDEVKPVVPDEPKPSNNVTPVVTKEDEVSEEEPESVPDTYRPASRKVTVIEPAEEEETYGDGTQVIYADDIDSIPDEMISKNEVVVNLGDGCISIGVVSKNEKDAHLYGNIKDVLNACLTDEEIGSVEKGSRIDVRLYVDSYLKDTDVSQKDREDIENAVDEFNASGKDLKIGRFVEISLEKNVDSRGWEAIYNLDGTIEIVLTIPKDIFRPTRTYYVLRKHGNECEIIDDIDVKEDTITFLTDRFSTYTILYTESEEEPAEKRDGFEAPGSDNTDKETSAAGNSADTVTIKEGRTFPWWIIIVIVVLCGAGYAYYKSKKKEESDAE